MKRTRMEAESKYDNPHYDVGNITIAIEEKLSNTIEQWSGGSIWYRIQHLLLIISPTEMLSLLSGIVQYLVGNFYFVLGYVRRS